jgi:hypothetical protein
MYIVVNDEVMKMDSMLAAAEGLIDQYSPVSGLDISRRFYAGLKLEENDDTYTISGFMFIPDEYFDDILSGMAGMNEIEQIENMEISFPRPIKMTMESDKETGLPLSMTMQYEMEMSMEVEGEIIIMTIDYSIEMPKFEYDVEFDTVVPQEIVDAAVEL